VQSVESQPTFRRNISSPYSGSKNNPSKKPEWEQVVSSSVDFQLITRRYIPQDRTIHNHRCENLFCIPVICNFQSNFHNILEITKLLKFLIVYIKRETRTAYDTFPNKFVNLYSSPVYAVYLRLMRSLVPQTTFHILRKSTILVCGRVIVTLKIVA
jgi:hypothetical protein